MATSEQELAATLITFADTLVSDYDVVDFLDLLVERSTDVLGAAAGGVMLGLGSDDLQLMVCTDERMRVVELFELQRQEGPCIDSYQRAEQVVEEDLAASTRWPQFSSVAVEEGYRSVFAFPLRLRGQVIGALNLFRTEPGPVEEADCHAAQAFADMATIGILQQRAISDARELAGQLQTALDTRIVIEQAKGILAERTGLDMGESFQALRSHARSHNQRLREVAASVVAGTLTSADIARPSSPGT